MDSELLGAAALLDAATRYGRAADNKNKNTLLKVLFFSKSSGYEHDVVKRIKDGSLSLKPHSESLGGNTVSMSSLRSMAACSIAI